MKQKFLLIPHIIMAITVTSLLTKELMSYAEYQNLRFQEATRILKRDCMMKMYEAEKERNVQKLLYYRYQYQNAGKVVMELGSDSIIQNFAKKKSRRAATQRD